MKHSSDEEEKAGGSIESLVLDSSPLLEAFGNAKTVRNVNSSRFGKFIQIDIQPETGKIVQGRINSYLLEKSRITKVSPGERCFHIFYQFLATKDLRDKFGLKKSDPDCYGFLKGGQHKIDGVDDALQLQTTLKSLESIGFTGE